MRKIKIIKVLVSALAAIIVFVIGYLKWYSYPQNVIQRITGINIPFFAVAEYESVQENWQDSHIMYVIHVSKEFSDEFLKGCETLGGKNAKMDYQDLDPIVVETMTSLVGETNVSGCQIKNELGDENWELVVEGRGLFFNYYFYDRP